jgi:glycosyltransferase involved in cell wall biosynthesis
MSVVPSSPSGVNLSVVATVYRSAPLVRPLVERLVAALEPLGLRYEILLVEDRGPDDSWAKITEVCASYPHVRGIRLSRNFGQQPAIAAGIDHAHGTWVVVMDGDLQDRPDVLPEFYQKAIAEDWQVVLARRIDRKDPLLRRTAAWAFYRTLSWLTGTPQDPTINAFGIYHRSAIDAVRSMGDYVRYLPTMVRWVGFRLTTVDVHHAAREAGSSTYNWSRLFRLATDVIVAFSDKPMRLMVKFGLTLTLFALVLAVTFIVQYFLGDQRVRGWASVFVSLWLIAGVLIAQLGVVGLYLGKAFEQVKGRPVYVVDQQLNTPGHGA